jgi:hypothetical protein
MAEPYPLSTLPAMRLFDRKPGRAIGKVVLAGF